MSDVIFVNCSPLAAMNRNEYRTSARFARLLMPALKMRMIRFNTQLSPFSLANPGSGGPEIETATPPGFNARRDFSSVLLSWLFRTTS